MSDSSYSLLQRIGELLLVILFCWLILDSFGFGVPPPISGVFIIPGYPIFGNAFQIWNNPAKVFIKWSQNYGTSVFQIRLGYKRIVVVNSFEDAKDIWIDHCTSVNSRPESYTFHGIVSANQGATIGSTPAGKDFVRKKKLISQYLNKKSVDSLVNVLDNETNLAIKRIILDNNELHCEPSNNHFRNFSTKFSDLDLLKYGQSFALRTSIFITYGIHLDCYKKDKDLADEIIEVENKIVNLRSPISNIQDYLPFLRSWPLSLLTNTTEAEKWRDRRDLYMRHLLNVTKDRIKSGDTNAINSLVGKMLLNRPHCSASDVNSISLTMVSAGLDNTSFTFNHIMGQLTRPEYGNTIQDVAFYELMNQSQNDIFQSWKVAATDMNCDYVKAIVQEGLRFFTVLPLSLPRMTTKDIELRQSASSSESLIKEASFKVIIPKGTTIFLNAFAVNHDEKLFPHPHQFIPERWLDPDTGKLLKCNTMFHFAFGAGSRKCSGNHLAFKELYTLTARMILMFKMKKPIDDSTMMELDPFDNNSHPSATSFEPRAFKIRLKQRMNKDSDNLYKYIIDKNKEIC